jgi:serine/threonine protein kinase
MEEIVSTLNEYGFKFLEVIFETPQSLILKIYSYIYKMDFVAKILNIFPANYISNIQNYTAEVKSLSEIYHPHVINIYEKFTDEKHLYIILEYCEGGSLLDYIKNNKGVEEQLLLEWMRQIVEALNKCHSLGISHRDIKPSNLLLNKQNRVKLADFGLSYFGKKNQMSLRFGGSLPYCAPEVLSGKKHDPFKADIWSLGITFYVLAFNCLPYKATTEAELKEQILNKIIEVPETNDPYISKMIRLMLNRDPNERVTCSDIIENKIIVKREDFKHLSTPLQKLSIRPCYCCSTQRELIKKQLIKRRNTKSAPIVCDALRCSSKNTF